MPIVHRGSRIVALEDVEGENDITWRDRQAVVPPGLRPEAVGHGGKVSRVIDRFSQQPIFARYFVQRRYEQRLVEQGDASAENALYPRNDDVEIVVRADHALADQAALGRSWVDESEMSELGRISQLV